MKLSTVVKRGFSLVEVVVAVGIFALAIVGVIGLLSPTNKAISDVADSDSANRVVTALQSEIQRLASTSAGWARLTTSTTPPKLVQLNTDITDTSDYLNQAQYTLFASKDGSIIGTYNDAVWNVAGLTTQKQKDQNKFFEVVLIRNWDASTTPATGLSDPANDGTAGYLAFTMRIRWPAFLPNGEQFNVNSQKSVMIVPAAVTR